MRLLAISLSTLVLGGCLTFEPPLCPGTRAYDPQICRGEKWIHIPNPPYYALQQKQKCDACIDVENTCGGMIPKQCRVQRKWQ